MFLIKSSADLSLSVPLLGGYFTATFSCNSEKLKLTVQLLGRCVFSLFFFVCLCWGFTAQSTQWGHVERGQFT